MRAIGVLVVLALALTACTSSTQVEYSVRAACKTPRPFLEVRGQRVPIRSSQGRHPSVRVRVGEVIRMRATGGCARSVSASPQNDRLATIEKPARSSTGSAYFKAMRPGTVRLVIVMPMCAQPPHTTQTEPCLGGVRELGTVFVSVVGPTR